jgi:hypothetical protein
MRLLRSIEETKTARENKNKNRKNSKINALEGKLTNNRMICNAQVFRTNKDRIPKKVQNMKVKGNHPRGRPRSRWKQHVRRDATQKETEEEEL